MPKKIKLNGIIGWDIYSEDVDRQLSRAGGQDIIIELSSPGGLVREGITIFNKIRNYEGAVSVHLIGNVASMGTYIALAGDEVTAEDNVTWMIHNPLNLAIGDYRVMQKNADRLDSLAGLLARVYVNATDKSMDEVRGLMDEESYFFGEEMVEAGFVDRIIENTRSGKKTATAMDKTEAVALARVEFENCVAKMKESEEAKTDIEQAAAMVGDMLGDKNIFKKKKGGAQGADLENPANADNGMEDISMKTLAELMAENPAMKAEVEAMASEKYNAGLKVGRDEVEARIKSAAPFLTADYPQPVKDLAVKVVKGEEAEAVLKSTVAVIDSLKEQKGEGEAQGDETPETPGEGGGGGGASEDGSVANEDEYQAELARAKAKGKGGAT